MKFKAFPFELSRSLVLNELVHEVSLVVLDAAQRVELSRLALQLDLLLCRSMKSRWLSSMRRSAFLAPAIGAQIAHPSHAPIYKIPYALINIDTFYSKDMDEISILIHYEW